MQTLKSLHTSTIQTMHQAVLAVYTPLALMKASKLIRLTVTVGYNVTATR